METNNNIINENIFRSISNKNNIPNKNALEIINNKNQSTMNDRSPLSNSKYYNKNLIPINKRKNSKTKIECTNSSFLTLRKNSDYSPKKRNDNSITINDNNINIISLSNLSNTNLISNKNENIFRKISRKDNIQNKDKEKISTINQINKIYDNNFKLKLKLNKDELIPKNKISNKCINRNFEKNRNFQRIRKNHYILIKSRTFNENKSSDINKNNSSKILKLFCFICNSYDERLYHARNCKHFFCNECGKNYFEQQIKKGIYTLKCPKYNCNKNCNLNSLKEMLSSESFIKLETYQKINNNLNKLTLIKLNEKFLQNINGLESNKRNSFETITNESYKGLNCFKKNFLKIPHDNKYKNNNMNFVQRAKHILKINNSSYFKSRLKIENEKNQDICKKCKNPSLFKRDDLTFIKCLNCGSTFCKYCFKKFKTSNKFHRLNLFCSACYQRKRKRKKESKFNQMKIEILLVFSGFFAVIIGFSKYEVEFFLKKNKRKFFILYLFFFVIIFFVNFIIAILFIPYFPIFTIMFR